ncbi:MAG: TonB-dependent receptor plug domain-containing protein [Alistipes sp.]
MREIITKLGLSFLLAGLILSCFEAAAQEQHAGSWWNSNPSFVTPIGEVSVHGNRPMKEIGIQKTQLDTLALRENIALSMADVLTFNSSIFIKQYGRATLSTVAFRGTAASHTQVLWNGMRINSPMLGMTDFSMIPSYFVDDAALLHGTSSVNVTGGGLGGAVVLATQPADTKGFKLQYVQGVGSYWTTDEFLRMTYGNGRWQGSTRAVYSSSPNQYSYRNHDKNENIYDADKQIIGTYHPIEKHRDGDFHDLHLLQELYYNTGKGDRLGLNVWFLRSDRGLSQTTVDYGDPKDMLHEQRERTLRSVVSWDHLRPTFKIGAKAGYIYTQMGYDYARDKGNGEWAYMTTSRSKVNTLFVSTEGEYYLNRKWLFTANLALHQHFAKSWDRNIITQQGNQAVVGYDKARMELSGYLSAKWMPTERLGLSLALREEMYGTDWTPIVPAFYADYLLSKQGNVRVKGSVSRNYRFPTLNDLYFQPGGNKDLLPEHGITYDAGVSFAVGKTGEYALHGEATWFDSSIDNWILWVPLGGKQDFWTPRNLKRVHAYGVELKAGFDRMLGKQWQVGVDGNFSWTPSINRSEPTSKGDASVGKQLVYVPEYSSALTARVNYKSWRLLYKWCYYSERYTMSSNDYTLTGYVPSYFMNEASLEKLFALPWSDFSAKIVIKNLFNEEYLSVLARPMPRLNFEIFLDIRPKWGYKKKR